MTLYRYVFRKNITVLVLRIQDKAFLLNFHLFGHICGRVQFFLNAASPSSQMQLHSSPLFYVDLPFQFFLLRAELIHSWTIVTFSRNLSIKHFMWQSADLASINIHVCIFLKCLLNSSWIIAISGYPLNVKLKLYKYLEFNIFKIVL